ncbi:MAG: hypothetical protein LBP60_01460 [Spirochaetaceae bacterium]|jgi:hypothetical protein|nr:hypothetical protein [Spirochaetaceae bacterium]
MKLQTFDCTGPSAFQGLKLGRGFFLLFLCLGIQVHGQTDSSAAQDPALLIGTTLSDLIGRYGIPKQVYAVRGIAAWQDDVVFVYDTGEFYIFGNRVWQLKFRSAYNIKDGDTKATVIRVLGEGRNFEGYTLFQLPSKVWPIMLRVNWDASDRAAGIYIYRSDF